MVYAWKSMLLFHCVFVDCSVTFQFFCVRLILCVRV